MFLATWKVFKYNLYKRDLHRNKWLDLFWYRVGRKEKKKKAGGIKMQIAACSERQYKDAPLNDVIAYKLNSDSAANH